jgi:type IV secretion system protein VirB10
MENNANLDRDAQPSIKENFTPSIKPIKNNLKNKRSKHLMIMGSVVALLIVSIVFVKIKTASAKTSEKAVAQEKLNDTNQQANTKNYRTFDEVPKPEVALDAEPVLPEISQQPIQIDDHSLQTPPKPKWKDYQYNSSACQGCGSNTAVGAINAPTEQNEELKQSTASNPNGLTQNVSNKATEFAPKKAALIKNQEFIVPMGTSASLVLKTRIDSTNAGNVIAELQEDIYSLDGSVALLDKRSIFIGHREKSIEEGAERLSVIWDRIQTPEGVIISINSLATDSLGGSGLDGYVNHQYMKRFGGGIVLSMISDLVTAQTNKGNIANNSQNTQQQTLSVAEQILNASINIKPIVYKNQGDIINVLINEDLDFSDVYKLRFAK